MANEKQLRETAKELITVLGLVDENKEDIVITKSTPIKEIKKIINDVIAEKLIAPTDELSEATKTLLESMTEETPKEAAERLHKENIANAKVNSVKGQKLPEESEEDEDSEEEEKKEEKIAEKKKPAKTAPAKKGNKKAERNVMVTRIGCVCNVLSNIPSKGRTLNELNLTADKDYAKISGDANPEQTMRYLRVLVPAAIAWKIISKTDDKYFSV